MKTTKKNMVVVRGDSYNYQLTFKSGGVAVDVSDYKIMFTVKENYTDSDEDAKIVKDLSVDDGTTGIVNLELEPDDTKIPVAKYYYDLQVVPPNGKVHTIMKGEFKVDWESSDRVTA